MTETRTDWHALGVPAAVEAVESDLENGLLAGIAAERLETHGRNVLPEGEKKTLPGMFVDQFKEFLVLILVGAAVVSAIMPLLGHGEGEFTDAIVIAAILVLNAILGVVQQYKAGKALDALKKMSVPSAETLRDGRWVEVSSEDLVPGDVIQLREGDFIPADVRLVEARNLRVDESSLTGESVPVEKSVEVLAAEATLPDRDNMAFSGTHVTYGRGRGLVVATGLEREIGRIAKMLDQGDPPATPLQRNLGSLGKMLGIVALGVCALVFVVGIAKGDDVFGMFMVAVSLAVAAIPEGLPAVVTIVLALGVYKMSKRHAIVRKLPAVETLGCANHICTDKTGTLTQNRMTVRREVTVTELLGTAGVPAAIRDRMRLVSVLCNDAHIEHVDGTDVRLGDPTELAFVDYLLQAGSDVDAIRERHPREGELPFDSSRKRMSTVHAVDGRRLVLVKGAPDVLFDLCSHYQGSDGPQPFEGAARERTESTLEEMSSSALRVLAFAYRELPDGTELDETHEQDLTLVGMMGMIDPPRDEARDALEECKAAGIEVTMITGDNPLTAAAIAGELGLMHDDDEVVTGRELEAMDGGELSRRVGHIRVFARVWPEQKLRIVAALQERGDVVSMTGDGVNDAPALRKADIGVAMGITGSDVAKGAADVVLSDDNFATIVHAVEEGRVIFDNIRKFVVYLLACNIAEILAIFLPILFGLGSPLWPAQILLINLITDGLPALALGVDTPEPGTMDRPPRDAGEGIVNRYLMGMVLYNAVFISAGVILAFWLGGRQGGTREQAMTMAFVALGLGELWRAQTARSDHFNVWQINPLSNPHLLGALALSASIVVLSVTWGPMCALFHNVPLTAQMWRTSLLCSLVPIVAYEVWKLVRRLDPNAKRH